MGPELAAVSGFALKVADDLVDELSRPQWALPCGLVAAAAALASVATGVRPDLYLGLILGNAVAGKIDEISHLAAAAIVALGVLITRPEVTPLTLLIITVLATLDEVIHPVEPTGLRPVLKIGAVVGWAFGVLDGITALAVITFDLGYHAAELLTGAIRCSNPIRA
ncbi:hypothetical protein [Methanopyrus kandleri]